MTSLLAGHSTRVYSLTHSILSAVMIFLGVRFFFIFTVTVSFSFDLNGAIQYHHASLVYLTDIPEMLQQQWMGNTGLPTTSGAKFRCGKFCSKDGLYATSSNNRERVNKRTYNIEKEGIKGRNGICRERERERKREREREGGREKERKTKTERQRQTEREGRCKLDRKLEENKSQREIEKVV